MGIDEGDTFSVSWISHYENSLNFYCELVIKAYENSLHSGTDSVISVLGNMKSKIRLEMSNGETFYDMSKWKQAVISGIQPMQEFVYCILEGMGMDDEEALDTTIEITEALEECNFNAINDPRLN